MIVAAPLHFLDIAARSSAFLFCRVRNLFHLKMIKIMIGGNVVRNLPPSLLKEDCNSLFLNESLPQTMTLPRRLDCANSCVDL